LNRPVQKIIWFIVCALFAILFVTPLLWMLAASLKPESEIMTTIGSLTAFIPNDFSLQNYADVMRRVPFLIYLSNSIVICFVIVGSGILVNSMAGYALARLRFRGKNFFLSLIIALIIVPFETILVPLFLEVNTLGWIDTYYGLTIPFIANAFNIFLFRQFFLGLPRSLEEAAVIDGASFFSIYFRIILPLSKPVVAATSIITFSVYWSDFLWPLIVTTGGARRTLAVGLGYFFHQPPIQWGDVMAYSVLSILPMILLFIFFQRAFVKGIASTGLK